MDLKEVCNKIVGQWYNDNPNEDEQIIFSLNTEPLRTSTEFIIINKGKVIKTVYGVGVKPSSDPAKIDSSYYYDIGNFEKTYYEIISLTNEELIVNQYYMIIDVPPAPNNIRYVRKADTNFADDILKGLD